MDKSLIRRNRLRRAGAAARPGRGRRRAGAAAVLVTVAALAAGCTVDGPAGQDKAAQEQEELKPHFSVADDAEGVSVLDPVSVSVEKGTLEKVSMTNEEGKEVKGALNPEGTEWKSDEVLGYGRTYTLAATADGKTTERTFTTVSPQYTAESYISPSGDAVVGVGEVIQINFDVTVPDRKAAQDAITITTDPPVEGAFYWYSGSQVRWRPAEFWKPGTKVNVEIDSYGKKLGGDVYGGDTSTASFSIGDEVIAVADDSTKTMTVNRNGVSEMSMPISMGRDAWLTPNGVYRVGEQRESMIMDSSTFGLSQSEGGYRTKVQYATQLSYSGIYVHAAPWSVGAQGSYNASHGCINVTTANAKWFMENTKPGDIVIVKNTKGDTLSGWDGLGEWNVPWETWKAGNADEGSGS